jgi:hypothetical protein
MEVIDALIGFGVLITLVILILQRVGERKDEKFEKRKW